jgi:O-antigen ligase
MSSRLTDSSAGRHRRPSPPSQAGRVGGGYQARIASADPGPKSNVTSDDPREEGAADMQSRLRLSTARVALWMVGAFVFSFPAQGGVAVAGVGSMSRLVGFAAFVIVVLSLVSRDRIRVRPPSLFLVVAALFVSWSAVTFFWSIAPSVTLVRINTYAQLAVLAWLVHQVVRDDRDLDFLWQAFVLGAYVMIGAGIAAFLGGERTGYRDVGGFNPNGFSIMAALAIPMAWGLTLRRSHGWLHMVNLVYPLFAIAAVVLAASRGGLLTALVALVIIPMTMGHLRLLPRVVVALALAGLVWVAAALVPTTFPELQRNIDRLAETDTELAGGTLTGRTVIWSAGIDVLRTSPLVGVGAGGFGSAMQPILGSVRGAHNAFITVVVETGLVGLSFFALLLVVALVGIIVNPTRRLEHLVLFGALIVAMMPTNSANDKFAWFILSAFASARPVLLIVRRVGAVVGRPIVPVTASSTSSSAGLEAVRPASTRR